MKAPAASLLKTGKLFADAVYVNVDAAFLYDKYQNQEELRNKIDSNSLKLSNQLKEVIEEQKRRKSTIY